MQQDYQVQFSLPPGRPSYKNELLASRSNMGYRQHPAQLLYTRESDYPPHQAGTALSQFGHVSRNASVQIPPSRPRRFPASLFSQPPTQPQHIQYSRQEPPILPQRSRQQQMQQHVPPPQPDYLLNQYQYQDGMIGSHHTDPFYNQQSETALNPYIQYRQSSHRSIPVHNEYNTTRFPTMNHRPTHSTPFKLSSRVDIPPGPSLHLDYEEKQWRIQHAEMLKQTAQQNQQRQSKVVNKQRDRGRIIPYLQDENIIQEGYPLMQPSFSQNMTESNWDTVSQPALSSPTRTKTASIKKRAAYPPLQPNQPLYQSNEIYSPVELASTYDEPSKVVASTSVGMTRSAKEMAHEKYLHRLSTPTTSRQSKTTLERYKSDHPDTLHGRHMGDSNKSSSSLPIAVNYIPYTHSEYRQLKSRDSHMHLPKGLGRNDDEEWKTQYDKRMRMHEYSELIRQRERESGRNDGMFDTIPHDVISFSNDDSLKHDQYRPRRKLSVVFSDDMVMKESVPTYRNRKVLAGYKPTSSIHSRAHSSNITPVTSNTVQNGKVNKLAVLPRISSNAESVKQKSDLETRVSTSHGKKLIFLDPTDKDIITKTAASESLNNVPDKSMLDQSEIQNNIERDSKNVDESVFNVNDVCNDTLTHSQAASDSSSMPTDIQPSEPSSIDNDQNDDDPMHLDGTITSHSHLEDIHTPLTHSQLEIATV
ncbi:hypothetical protein RTP6_005892 [Batrachochytrium dendrobatidis]